MKSHFAISPLKLIQILQFTKLRVTANVINAPLFHAALDLDGLVAAVDDPDVDLAGIRLLLPQEVVDARLDVGAQSRRRKVLGDVPVRRPLRVAPLVAVITDVPGGITGMGVLTELATHRTLHCW